MVDKENMKNSQLFCDRHMKFEDVSCETFREFGINDNEARDHGMRAIYDCGYEE